MCHPSTVLRTGSKLVAEQSSSYSHILQGEAPHQNSCSTARSALARAEVPWERCSEQGRAHTTTSPTPGYNQDHGLPTGITAHLWRAQFLQAGGWHRSTEPNRIAGRGANG